MDVDDTLVWGSYAPGPVARIAIYLSRSTPLGRGKARQLIRYLIKTGRGGGN